MTNVLRVAHISDTHLGYKAYLLKDPISQRNQRSVDFAVALECTVSDLLLCKPDLVIHSGDVFHQPKPAWLDIKAFLQQMNRITRVGIPLIIIGGNHDTPRLRQGGSVFSVAEVAVLDAHFVCGYEEETIHLPLLNTAVHCVPYGYLHTSMEVHEPSKVDRFNILTMHGAVMSSITPVQFQHTAPDDDIQYSGEGYDYIALGHHHLHYKAKARAWYAGSTERNGFSDENSTPGWVLATLDKEAGLTVEHRPIPSRPMKTLAPVDCDGKEDALEIAEEIQRLIADWNQPQGIARIELVKPTRGIIHRVRHAVERVVDNCWLPLIYTNSEITFGRYESVKNLPSAKMSLPGLFAEFIASRPYGSDSAFGEAFKTKGLAALAEAQQNQDGGE